MPLSQWAAKMAVRHAGERVGRLLFGAVAAEAYFALQQHYRKTKEEALEALRGFSSGEGISFSQNFAASINTPNIHKANPGLVDRMLVSGYREQGQITLSCEKSFRRLADTEVIS